ncbi:MAG: MBL fold metallo-hydrolase [Clostridia bacterium]|nr:MBL fold metallo-hydrolase [Clostridia bacterium]
MKKLRILSVIFVLLMGMFAVACVGNDPADSTEAETTKQNEPDVTTDETDTKATEETEEVTTEQTTEEVTEPETDPYENLPTEISLPAEYEASDIVYECDDGSVVYTYRGKTAAEYEAVCAFYTRGGYAVYSSSDKSDVLATTFVGNGPMAHIYLMKKQSELNIVISKDAVNTLPPAAPAVTDGEFTCTVAQLKDNVNVNGMSYVIQLKDGSFIVYDGGYQSQVTLLLKYLKDAHKGEGKPLVRAWVLTHSHNDHYPAFTTIATNKRFQNQITVEHVIFAPMNDAKYSMPNDDYDAYFSTQLYEDVKGFEGAKLTFAHTGMEFRFCNLNMEILCSPETLYRERTELGNFNDTSIVSRLYGDGYSALFLGDIGGDGTKAMMSWYGDYLQSDMCQASHHGIEACHVPLYDVVKPQILFYPCNLWLYDADGYGRDGKVAMENKDYVKEILIAGCNTFVRDWGTRYAADAELLMPEYTRPGTEGENDKNEPIPSDRLVMEKDTFLVGEAITVIAEGSGTDWIGIQTVREFNNGIGSAYWWYIESIGSGTEFNLIGSTDGDGRTVQLPVGEYVIRLLPNDTYFQSEDPVAHMYFKVVESADEVVPEPDDPEVPEDGNNGVPGKFTMDKTVFAAGEPIMATASAGTHAWLELHYEVNGSYVGFDWCYVGEGGIAVDEPFNLRNVVFWNGAAYSFTTGKYKIIWYPTDDRANEVVIEFEIQ